MVLRLNESLKLAELIPRTRLLRPSTNLRPCLQSILYSSRVVDNDSEDPFPLPKISMPKEVHLRRLVT